MEDILHLALVALIPPAKRKFIPLVFSMINWMAIGLSSLSNLSFSVSAKAKLLESYRFSMLIMKPYTLKLEKIPASQ